MTINTMLKMVKDLTEDIYDQIQMYGCGWSYEEDHKLAKDYINDINDNMHDIELNVFLDSRNYKPDHKVSENDIPNLVEYIGTEATLEQLAEEACELGHAALKQAREMRGENATHKDPEDIRNNLIEEIADVSVTIYQVIKNTGYISEEDVQEAFEQKTKRMKERLAAEDKKKEQKKSQTVNDELNKITKDVTDESNECLRSEGMVNVNDIINDLMKELKGVKENES